MERYFRHGNSVLRSDERTAESSLIAGRSEMHGTRRRGRRSLLQW